MVLCKMLGGLCHPDTETLTLTAAHSHKSPGFEVFCANALFCVREVWQDFIRVVVLCLLSQITKFHSSKQKTDLSI